MYWTSSSARKTYSTGRLAWNAERGVGAIKVLSFTGVPILYVPGENPTPGWSIKNKSKPGPYAILVAPLGIFTHVTPSSIDDE